MLIRAGQHVGVDGRVYHPYLRDWNRIWDRASVAEFLEFLQQVFAKEPPVISKAQQQQYQRPIGQPPPQPQQQPGASPAPPQIPPKQRIGSPEAAEMPSDEAPPPRPPKLGDDLAERFPPRTSSRDISRDGPSLPPLPHERPSSQSYTSSSRHSNGYGPSSQARSYPGPNQQQIQQNGRGPGPPLPPLPSQSALQQPLYQQRYDRSPVSPVSPMNGYSELPETKYSRPAPVPSQQPQHYQQQPPPATAGSQLPPLHPQFAQTYQQPQPRASYPPNHHYPQQMQLQQPPQLKKQPPPDLLSDPFEVTLSGPSSGPAAPAPPIPPNPEKEHLLHAVSASLVHQAQENVHQNLSAIAPLQAQQHALRAAHERLESEIRQLEQLDQTLASNEAILRRSIQDCDRTIATAKSKPPPPIDEVLIAPTMVANQLWTLCAEEAACREAMYVLQKAVDRGRVNGNDFVRQMRSLGRECFLKMVLARKCARGLGLEVHRR